MRRRSYLIDLTASPLSLLLRVLFESLDDKIVVGVDTNVGSNLHRLAANLLGIEMRLVDQCTRGGERVGTTRSDTNDAVVRLHNITITSERVRLLVVRDDENRLEMTQVLVCSPGLGELHARTRELARVLFELALETLHQRERVGGGASKAGDNVLIDTTHFLGVWLDDRVAKRHLTIANQTHFTVLAHAENRRAVHRWSAAEVRHAAECL